MKTTTNLIKSLLIATLLASAAAQAADSSIVIALEDGKQVASFKVGDSSCVLKDDQIRCAPGNK
jgi:hypothetical protein